MMELADRVKELVDRYHDGSVNAAAHDIGIPQSTLARIVDRRVTNPRSDAIARIGAFYNVTLDWLVRGVGVEAQSQTPDGLQMSAEWLLWRASVNRVASEPGELRNALLQLPTAIATAWRVLESAMSVRTDLTPKIEDIDVAIRFELSAWRTLLESFHACVNTAPQSLTEDSDDELADNADTILAQILQRRIGEIQLGFNRFAIQRWKKTEHSPDLTDDFHEYVLMPGWDVAGVAQAREAFSEASRRPPQPARDADRTRRRRPGRK